MDAPPPNSPILIPHNGAVGTEGTRVLHRGGGIETAGAYNIDLFNHDGEREGRTLGLEESKFIFFNFSCCVITWFYDSWSC